MMRQDPQEVIDQLSRVLRRSAAEIDGAFARAGERLGRGMEIFESLHHSMAGLSNELGAADMRDATQALSDLADELRALSDALPAETAMLRQITVHNAEASAFMNLLLENMRMMTVLARAARIEAAAVMAASEGFADFTGEVLTFTKNAQESVGACARHQANLSALLREATRAQFDFERQYRSKLASLSAELTEIFGSLQEKRARSAGLTVQAAAHSRTLAQAVGGAIIALQGGDSARQRLEHVCAATRIIVQMFRSVAEDGDDAAFIVDLLRRLQSAQLDDATQDLGRDLGDIAGSLDKLSQDADRLVELGRHLYGGADDSGASFLDALQSKLAEALILIGKCESARAPIDRVTSALGVMLEQFDATVRSLNSIISEIVRIGINAGLKASRLGPEGRGLVVIAQELKDIAKHISSAAAGLTPIIKLIQTAAAGLDRKDMHGAGQIGVIDGTLRTALDQLREGNLRLAGALERLVGDGVEFGDMLGKAQADIAETDATNETVRQAAEQLRELCVAPVAAPTQQQEARARAAVDALVRATYTMDAERKIHDRLVGEIDQLAAAAGF